MDYNQNNNNHQSLDEIEENEQKEKKKKKQFNFFNRYTLDGKGVAKDEINIIENPNLKNFFKLLARKFNQLLSVNLLIIFGNFPIFVILFGIGGYLNPSLSTPESPVYALLRGVSYYDKSPITAALGTIYGMETGYFSLFHMSLATTILLLVGVILLSFTFGLVNVGISYILRNMVKGEPIFMWSDFWYAIKRNIRQGFIFGIIDLFLMFMLVYDIQVYLYNSQDTLMSIFFFMSFAMAVVYFFMRMYIYLMMVTFDLSIFKLIKNSLIFSVLGIKRNVMALLGVILLLFFNYFIFLLFVPIGVILPFIITLALGAFICAYAAYPKIKEIMIDPYYKDEEPEDYEEPIFIDRG